MVASNLLKPKIYYSIVCGTGMLIPAAFFIKSYLAIPTLPKAFMPKPRNLIQAGNSDLKL
jgi:hypothetical protein